MTSRQIDTTRVLEIVEQALQAAYGVAVVRCSDDGVVRVMGGRPLEIARKAVESSGVLGELARSEEGIAAIIDEIDVESLPWFSASASVDSIQLWRNHGRTDEMVSETIPGDPPVRLIAKTGDWHLARLFCGSTGWVHDEVVSRGLVEIEREAGEEQIRNCRAKRLIMEVDNFLRVIHSFMGVPYVWGGTTTRGVDCSGLVQRAGWESSGVWLPRHSTHLMRAGKRVKPSSPGVGDVLVLKRKSDAAPDAAGRGAGSGGVHPMHIAVLTEAGLAAHASRDAMRVVEEPLGDLLTRYKVLSVRRIAVESDAIFA